MSAAAVSSTATRRLVASPGKPGDPYPFPPAKAFMTEDLPDYIEAEDLRKIAGALIKAHDLRHLDPDRLHWLWKAEGGETSGRRTLGRCIKVGGLAAFYGRDAHDFAAWLAHDHCNALRLTRWQVEALVFHVLCQAGYAGEERKPYIIAPEFAGYVAEVEHYGLWSAELARAGSAFQAALPFEADEG